MNEVLFYGGLLLAISAFVMAIILFFKNDILSVVRYYLKYNVQYLKLKNSMPAQKKEVKNKEEDLEKETELIYQELTELLSSEEEQIEETEILGASSYATALLIADNTVLLPDINESQESEVNLQ